MKNAYRRVAQGWRREEQGPASDTQRSRGKCCRAIARASGAVAAILLANLLPSVSEAGCHERGGLVASVHQEGTWRIGLIDPREATFSPLTDGRLDHRSGSVNKADGRLAFSASDGRIYLKGCGEGNARALTDTGTRYADVAWRGGGDTLLATRYRFTEAGEDSDIVAIDATTGSADPVVVQTGLQGDSAPSPVGDGLAYVSGNTLRLRKGDVRVVQQLWLGVPARGTAWQISMPTARHTQPAWAPDGQRLAFASDLSGRREIWTVDLNTGERTQLTDSRAYETSPAWSPNGSHIAFIAREGARHAVRIVSIDDGTVRDVRLFDDATTPIMDLTWR